MLEIVTLHVGNLKENYYKEAVSEYSKRLSAYCKFTDKEIKEVLLSENPSQSEIDAALSKEGEAIISAIGKKAYVIALCVEGKQISSEELADIIEKVPTTSGLDKIVFLIGSSYGLAPTVKAVANCKISFSKMTFPHRLMRVMLAEQVYRAFTIISGKRYHK